MCVAEVYEELNIQLSKDDVIWSGIYPLDETKQFVFFLVGNLAQEEFDRIYFGDEGQGL